MEYTLSILKPDALQRNITGKVNTMIEEKGLKIVAQKLIHLTKQQACAFYKEHEGKPFFDAMTDQMCSSPVVVQVLKSQNAVAEYRNIMGATNPQDAKEGTIRKTYGLQLSQNTVHGSDSSESAKREISFFFSKTEIF